MSGSGGTGGSDEEEGFEIPDGSSSSTSPSPVPADTDGGESSEVATDVPTSEVPSSSYADTPQKKKKASPKRQNRASNNPVSPSSASSVSDLSYSDDDSSSSSSSSDKTTPPEPPSSPPQTEELEEDTNNATIPQAGMQIDKEMEEKGEEVEVEVEVEEEEGEAEVKGAGGEEEEEEEEEEEGVKEEMVVKPAKPPTPLSSRSRSVSSRSELSASRRSSPSETQTPPPIVSDVIDDEDEIVPYPPHPIEEEEEEEEEGDEDDRIADDEGEESVGVVACRLVKGKKGGRRRKRKKQVVQVMLYSPSERNVFTRLYPEIFSRTPSALQKILRPSKLDPVGTNSGKWVAAPPRTVRPGEGSPALYTGPRFAPRPPALTSPPKLPCKPEEGSPKRGRRPPKPNTNAYNTLVPLTQEATASHISKPSRVGKHIALQGARHRRRLKLPKVKETKGKRLGVPTVMLLSKDALQARVVKLQNDKITLERRVQELEARG